MRPDFPLLWSTCVIRPELTRAVQREACRLLKSEKRYRAMADEFRMPWEIVAVIDYRESGGGCKAHLANGDSLLHRTHNVPAGLPKEGEPPFSWEQGARAALRHDGVLGVKAWTVTNALDFLERYNGLGYRLKGLPSPYLWGVTNHQQKGKYVKDGVFDPDKMDTQLGVCALLKALGWKPA